MLINDNTVPFTLTTKEVLQKIKNSLNIDGLVITNIVSAINGRKSIFLKSEYLTYGKIFSKIDLFQVDSKKMDDIQNVIMLSFINKNQKPLDQSNTELKNFMRHKIYSLNYPPGLILTDNYSPVENMLIR